MTLITDKPKQNYFLSQPHQPFFLLGITNAIIMMLIFGLNYKGVFALNISTLNFHVYTLVFTVFTNVFTGFLFTTFPRFCHSDVVQKDYYSKIFFANIVGSLVFLTGVFINELIMNLGMWILFTSQVFIVLKLHHIFKTGLSDQKEDPHWILMAQYFGIIAHILFLISQFGLGFENVAIKVSFYMYIIFLTFAVGQRMIPFFSHSREEKDERFISTVFVLFALKTILSTFDSYTYVKVAEILLDILLGLYLLGEFLNWKLTPFSAPAIVWVLQLGLFWLPTAFFLSALSLTAELFLDTSFYFLNIHLLALGFLTTILIGFGTRVTLGHSGQPPHADKFVIGLFWFTQVVVILRALFSINVAFGWGLNFLFDISFTAWLLMFLLWSSRYAKVLMFGTKV
ncbi:NnrS family protein [Sulfurimonas sp.]